MPPEVRPLVRLPAGARVRVGRRSAPTEGPFDGLELPKGRVRGARSEPVLVGILLHGRCARGVARRQRPCCAEERHPVAGAGGHRDLRAQEIPLRSPGRSPVDPRGGTPSFRPSRARLRPCHPGGGGPHQGDHGQSQEEPPKREARAAEVGVVPGEVHRQSDKGRPRPEEGQVGFEPVRGAPERGARVVTLREGARALTLVQHRLERAPFAGGPPPGGAGSIEAIGPRPGYPTARTDPGINV